MSDTTQPATSTTPTPDNWESLDEPIAWRPSDEYLQRSRLLRFMRQHDIGDYAALLRARATIPRGSGTPSPTTSVSSGSAPIRR